MTATPRARRRLVPLAVLALVLGGCGVAGQDGATPFPVPTRHATATTVAGRATTIVYLVGPDDRLTAVTRPARPGPALAAAMAALRDGPTATESAEGLRTALPGDVAVRAVGAGAKVRVDLTGDVDRIRSRDQVLAAGQLVLTATAVPGVRAVVVLVGGRAIALPRPDGSVQPGSATAADYAGLAGGRA